MPKLIAIMFVAATLVMFQNCSPFSPQSADSREANSNSGPNTIVDGRSKFLSWNASFAPEFSCVLSDIGEPSCRGENQFEQIDSSGMDILTSTKIAGLPPVSRMVYDSNYSIPCAILRNGKVICWGTKQANFHVSGLHQLTDVRALVHRQLYGDFFSLHKDGSVQRYSYGNLTSIPLPSPAIQIAASGGDIACFLLQTGAVRCFGGQTGLGFPAQFEDRPANYSYSSDASQDVPGFESGVVMISAGASNLCAVMNDATVRCIGYGTSGVLGSGSAANSSTYVNVPLKAGALAVQIAGSSACALLEDRTVQCWGAVLDPEFGLGASSLLVPHTIPGVTGVDALFEAYAFGGFCAAINDGTKKCWGITSQKTIGLPASGSLQGVATVN